MATATISGQLVNPTNMRLVALIRLVADGLEDLGFGSEVATTLPDANGEFVFLNVPSGSYVIDITPSASEYGTVSRSFGDFPRIPGTSGGGMSITDVPVGPPGTTHSTFTNGASVSGFSARVRELYPGGLTVSTMRTSGLAPLKARLRELERAGRPTVRVRLAMSDGARLAALYREGLDLARQVRSVGLGVSSRSARRGG